MNDSTFVDVTDQAKQSQGSAAAGTAVYLSGRASVRRWSAGSVLAVCLAVGFACTGVGVLIGFFCRGYDQSADRAWVTLQEQENQRTADRIKGDVNSDSIREFHSKFSSLPHLAGSDADYKTAKQVADIWKDQGLDSVEIVPYNVLLSYPDTNRPNKVEIKSAAGDVVYSSAAREEALTVEYDHEDIVPPYNAYSPAGVVEGELLYVNHGSPQDFQQLKLLGIDVTGKIVIARYGAGFRGDKVRNAERAGAVGVILYSDMSPQARQGAAQVYPHTWWLPGSGVERGSINIEQGDPLTQGFPANEYSYKEKQSTVQQFLPKIPCQPIAYNDAKELLRHLRGPEVPKYWQGGLDIGKYRIGPGFDKISSYGKVRLEVNNYLENRTIYNVIGRINGRIEPDRYVLLSNHRDAWVYGAVDPITGTAAMMEMSRIFGKIKQSGVRPRRSILFCSWSAEEFGLIGSYEYVEHYEKMLMERAVAVLNVDTAVKGNRTLSVRATPAMWDLVYDAAKTVQAPFSDDKSLYDVWDTEMPFKRDTPVIFLPESSTDYAPFLQRTGIEVSEMSFMGSMDSYTSNPLYHTRYETIHLIKFIDPEFKCHKAITLLWLEMARNLADSVIIPFNLTRLAAELSREAQQGLMHQENNVHGELLRTRGISFRGVYSAVENFTVAARAFHLTLDRTDRRNVLAVRMLNDRLMQVTRTFIHHGGLPGRPLLRNLVFAPYGSNTYLGTIFPGMYDILHSLNGIVDTEVLNKKLDDLLRHVATLTHVIQSGADILKSDYAT